MRTGSLTPMSLLKQRYRILSQVGKGGFGAVYQAEDTALGRRLVAVKEMSQSHLNTQELCARIEAFEREALLLAGLSHANLPHIYDYFTDNGQWYLVMDFIEGHTLDDYLARHGGHLPLEEVLRLAIQLCTVLDYLHTRQPPVIFRDLKPDNIMLTHEKQPVLIDFGIARHFKPGQSRDTIALGSPGYAAPEQYGKAQTTPQTDIYSLGALLHFLLSGDDPSEHPFQFAPLKAPVLPGLNILITQMLEINASMRPTSMSIVKEQLERFAAQEAAQQKNNAPGALPSPRQQAPSKPVISLARPKPVPARRKKSNYQVTSIAWSFDVTRIAAAHIDGTVQIIDVLTGNTLGSYRKYVASSMLPMGYVACWSPDGKQVASGGDGAMLQVWSVDTGRTIFAYSKHGGNIRAVKWSPAGQHIASLDSSETIQVWEAATGKTLLTKSELGSRARTLSWSPDGKYLAAERDNSLSLWGGTKTFIFVWQAVTGEEICHYKEHAEGITNIAWSPDGSLVASASGFDTAIKVWHVLTGKTVSTYGKHTRHGLQVGWLPGGKQIASVDLKGEVHVWDAVKGELTAIYRAYDNETMYLWPSAWSPDGLQLAFADNEGEVKFWSLPIRP